MAVVFDIQASYSSNDVQLARKLVDELLPQKTDVFLSNQIKKALITLAISVDDAHGIYGICKTLFQQLDTYYSLSPFSSSQAEVLLEDIAISRDQLVSAARVFYKSLNLSSIRFYGVLLAFFPDRFNISGCEISFSEILVNTQLRLHEHYAVAVAPPTSVSSYRLLLRAFDNDDLLRLLGASNINIMSKYYNGRITPPATTWGVFLVSIGLHPKYKLKVRESIPVAQMSLMRLILPGYDKHSGGFEPLILNIAHAKKMQIERGERKQIVAQFMALVQQWYANGGKLDSFSSAEEIYDHLHAANAHEYLHPIIHSLYSKKVLTNKTSHYVNAFSEMAYNPIDVAQLIQSARLQQARNVLLNPNPNPNIYILLRSLVGDARSIADIACISRDAWFKYEQSSRQPHHTTWTVILLSLGIHPYFTLEIRNNEHVSTKLIQKIFYALHSKSNLLE